MGFEKAKNLIGRFRKTPQIIIYRNCEEISIYNLNKLFITNDLRYLIKGFNGRNEIKIPDVLSEVYNDIINEYCELIGSRKAIQYYELLSTISRLETRYLSVSILIYSLEYETGKHIIDSIVDELHRWGFHINKKESLQSQIPKLKRQLRSSKTKINRKIEELEEYEDDSESPDIIQQKLVLENILGKNNINLKKISALEWVKMNKLSSTISKNRNRGRAN